MRLGPQDIVALLGFDRDALPSVSDGDMRAGLHALFHAVMDGHWVERGPCDHDIRTCCDGPWPDGKEVRRVEQLCAACTQAKASTWVRLKPRNDWGRRYYTLPWEGLNGYGCNDDAKELAIPSKLPVRWPDGSETLADVVLASYTTTVSDMGRESTYRGMVPKIRLVTNGVESLVDLYEVEVRADVFAVPEEP